jgi:hypothetical protein
MHDGEESEATVTHGRPTCEQKLWEGSKSTTAKFSSIFPCFCLQPLFHYFPNFCFQPLFHISLNYAGSPRAPAPPVGGRSPSAASSSGSLPAEALPSAWPSAPGSAPAAAPLPCGPTASPAAAGCWRERSLRVISLSTNGRLRERRLRFRLRWLRSVAQRAHHQQRPGWTPSLGALEVQGERVCGLAK